MNRRRFLQSGASIATLCGYGGAQSQNVAPTRVLAVFGSLEIPASTGQQEPARLYPRVSLYKFRDGQAHKIWQDPTPVPQSPMELVRRAEMQPLIADVDGDGNNELITMSLEGLTVWKTPKMSPYRLPIALRSGFPVFGVGAPADNGVQKIFAGGSSTPAGQQGATGCVGVFTFDGKQFTTVAAPVEIPCIAGLTQIRVFDVNGDNRPEVLIAGRMKKPDNNSATACVAVYGLEGNKLVEQARLSCRTQINHSVRYADIDDDGAKEIVASGSVIPPADPFDGLTAWRYDSRTGKYDQTLEYALRISTPESMDVGDVDGDRKNEVVIATSGANVRRSTPAEQTAARLENQHLTILRYERGGMRVLYDEPSGVMAHFGGISIGDLDGDGANEFCLQGTYIYKRKEDKYVRTPVIPGANYCAVGDLSITANSK